VIRSYLDTMRKQDGHLLKITASSGVQLLRSARGSIPKIRFHELFQVRNWLTTSIVKHRPNALNSLPPHPIKTTQGTDSPSTVSDRHTPVHPAEGGSLFPQSRNLLPRMFPCRSNCFIYSTSRRFNLRSDSWKSGSLVRSDSFCAYPREARVIPTLAATCDRSKSVTFKSSAPNRDGQTRPAK
jgi:hypothetical protein